MYTEPVRLFLRLVLPFRLWMAIRLVNRPSWMPSGISLPAASRMAGLVIRWPTLRTNSRLRPCRDQLGTVGLGVDAVRVHGAGEGAATLADFFSQVAFHQAQPVAVDHDLVVGIDGGHRSLRSP